MKTKAGSAEVIVLFPSGEFGYVGCYLIRLRDGSISISRGDSHIVRIGGWTRQEKVVTVTSRVVYQDGSIAGRAIPGPETVEEFTRASDRLQRAKDKTWFRPLPRLRDLEFLATLISCDRAYWDGAARLSGPQPCMPSLVGEPLDAALKRLATVGTFAFGGVGYAGKTSPGEIDFRIVLSQPAPVALAAFEKLYADGNPQAKSYALSGIRTLAPGRFKDLLAAAGASTIEVAVMRGCIGGREPLRTVAEEIDRGEFPFRLDKR